MVMNGDEVNEIKPQPTPITYKIGTARMQNGQELVLIQFLLVTGSTVLFLEREQAGMLADALKAHSSGLTVTKQIPDLSNVDDLMRRIKGEGS
jgi:hypothetical protein